MSPGPVREDHGAGGGGEPLLPSRSTELPEVAQGEDRALCLPPLPHASPPFWTPPTRAPLGSAPWSCDREVPGTPGRRPRFPLSYTGAGDKPGLSQGEKEKDRTGAGPGWGGMSSGPLQDPALATGLRGDVGSGILPTGLSGGKVHRSFRSQFRSGIHRVCSPRGTFRIPGQPVWAPR